MVFIHRDEHAICDEDAFEQHLNHAFGGCFVPVPLDDLISVKQLGSVLDKPYDSAALGGVVWTYPDVNLMTSSWNSEIATLTEA